MASTILFASALAGLFASSPTSTNFTLKAYDFGNGGGSSSTSNYNLNGTTGLQTGAPQSSTNFGLKPGEIPTQDTNVPPAGTLSNPDNTYNKLKLVIATGSNPSDTKFAIAISNDNFATTQYVQNDNGVGSVLGIEDYQTYTVWGGAGGFNILSLVPNTSYQIRVSALQGNFTGSAFGPASTAVSTSQPSIAFGVSTSLNSTPPFELNFPSLLPNTVVSANAQAVVTLTSNAAFGGAVYIKDSNSGLFSASKSFTLTSASTDLTAAASGYGAQVTTTSQTSGGPFSSAAPFSGVNDNVGVLSSNPQVAINTSGPLVTGTANIALKAKTASATPAAQDYSDTLTIIASMLF